MTNIKALLSKGNIRGEEVGRLMVRDYVRMMDSVYKGEAPADSMFTEAEKQTLVNKLNTSQDIRDYNAYIGILNYLKKLAIIHLENNKDLRHLSLLLHTSVHNVHKIEAIQALLGEGGLIMTDKQYKRLKKEDLQVKLAKTTSVGGIVLTACQYYVNKYQLIDRKIKRGKTDEEGTVKKDAYTVVKTLLDNHPDDKGVVGDIIGEDLERLKGNAPYADLFKKYESEPLTNPKFRANYYAEMANMHIETPDGKSNKELPIKEWVQEVKKWHRKEVEDGQKYLIEVDDGREAPEDATKWDILEFLSGFFNVGETTTKEDLDTFREDYPELYNALLEEIKGIKGLELPEDYADPTISYKTLHELNLPYYRGYFRYDPKDGDAFIARFISVIPDEEIEKFSTWEYAHYLDGEGNYKYELDEVDQLRIETVRGTVDRVSDVLSMRFALQEIYRQLGDHLREKSIKALADIPLDNGNYGDVHFHVENYNDSVQDLKRRLRNTSPVISEELIQEIHTLINAIPEITIKELKPTKEAIERAKELAHDLSYYDNQGLYLLDVLMGVTHE